MIREAKTENGWVRGIEAADPRITAFKGIPFAAPPVGENRWRAPQPCGDWEGVRDASRFAPISMQNIPGLGDDIYTREWHVDPEIAMSEDCLYLNIWTGAGRQDEKLPVLVWFFGGGLQCGYTAEMEFDGERLARRGIVVVSVNYRVNVFGFLAHPQLTMEQPKAPTNFGSLDQQAGLRWVIRNIAAFGGDPENITIAGQSAGGGSVLSQMTCPDNFGMFQKAVIMSAMIRSPYGEGGVGVPQPLWEAEENGQHFFGFLGVSGLEEARALDAALIRDKYEEYLRVFAGMCPPMCTVVDDCFCAGDPMELFLAGKHADVAVMAGNTADEFLNFIPADSEKELEEKAKEIFGEDADTFLAFPESRKKEEQRGYAGVSGTECTIKGIFANEKGEHGERYYYRFDPDIPGWDQPGTFHSSDLWFFFETLAKCWRPFVGRHYDLARKMCTYWANFIKTGNPNGPDADGSLLKEWRPYTKENPCGMAFESAGERAFCGEETAFASFLTDRIVRSLERGKTWQDGWIRPIWKGDGIFRETFAMVEEDGKVEAPFLFAPDKILRVESYDGQTVYEEGRDYRAEAGLLKLTDGSRIPHTGWNTFLYDTKKEAEEALERAEFRMDFGPVQATDGRYLNLDPIGHPQLVTRWQVAVTYTSARKRFAAVQKSCMGQLPLLSKKLAKGGPIKVVLFGDSISCGFDSSGKYGQKPGQPVWAELLVHQMKEKWKCPVVFHNTSLGGMDTEWAIEKAGERAGRYHPDLAILGFGMNDRCPGDEYREKTQRFIDTVRRDSPETEILLISTSLPNPLAATAPMHFWAHQEEYSKALEELCGEGIALADVQKVHREIAERKRYIDVTGNWLNHPNDFLARIYAQVAACALGLIEE